MPRPAELMRKVRRILTRHQGSICPLCGKEIEIWYDASLDHVWPKSKGGPDLMGNLVASHPPCNRRKADRMPTGCELVWLIAVNARMGIKPDRF